MSDKETIGTLLTILNARQAKLTIICKELTDWVEAQGGHHVARKAQPFFKDIEDDNDFVRDALMSLIINEPLKRE